MRSRRLQNLVVNCCGFFMLFLLPLLFRDAFFDINRFKVQAVLFVIPVVACIALFLHIGNRSMPHTSYVVHPAQIWLCLLLLTVWISSAMAGFDPATLTGSEGRYCGAWFLSACVAACLIMSARESKVGFLAAAACVSASIVSFLGTLNILGVDPLGFYLRMQKGQEHVFLSTIGNVDFFGAYLAMLLPLSAFFAVCGRMRVKRWLSLLSCMLMMVGICISRTDVAFAASQVSFLVLVLLHGNSWTGMQRILLTWSGSWLCIPIGRFILQLSPYGLDYSGMLLMLCERKVPFLLCALLLILGWLCAYAYRNGFSVPRRRRLCLISFIALLIIACAVAVGMYFATSCLPEREATGIWRLFRLDDAWGSRRGFVYRRSLRAFSAFSLPKKLFGVGVDLTRRILSPYFDNPEMLQYGVFNDAHCQPLQFLLTCGIVGMVCFLGFYLSVLYAAFRHTEEQPLMRGVAASLGSYAVIMLLSVTQPILIAMYFSLCALALSCIRARL